MIATPLATALDVVRDVDLTDRDIAVITGAHNRTVKRWRTGESEPRREPGERLLELGYVAAEAARTIQPDDVNWWMFTPNDLLHGEKPSELIAKGRYREVLDLLEAMADGVAL